MLAVARTTLPEQVAETPTSLLAAWREGDGSALNQLMEILYHDLARVARGALRRERRDHTLSTRALVHEAYMRLIGAEVDWRDRAHFFSLAARTMRRVLTDHAKARARVRRGGAPIRVELHDVASSLPSIDLLDLEAAFEKLEARDPRNAQLAELHFYAGLDYDEAAAIAGVSPRTVGRDLRVARAFLARELGLRSA